MRILLFLSCFVVSLNLFARAEGRYLGLNYMINLVSTEFDGSFDHTPARLYAQMNVPEQQSFLGLGKALQVSKKEMSFICSKKAENNYQCSILIFNSPQGSIALRSAQIKYTGEQAKAITSQFFLNEDGSDLVITDDSGQFNLIMRSDFFQLTFNAQK